MKELKLFDKRFGRLIAIKRIGTRHSKALWECKCDCGNTTAVTSTNLNRGITKSCGCLCVDHARSLGKSNRKAHHESSFNTLFTSYKTNAKKRNIDFHLDKNEFRKLTTQSCHYCGSPPTQVRKNRNGKYKSYIYNGVDRIDNEEGYTPNNCVPCCKDCNIAKGTKSLQEFVRWIEQVYVYSVKGNYP